MQLRILKFPSGHSLTQLSRKKKSLFLFLTNVMGTLRACLCGGDVEGGWGGGKEGGGEKDWREREMLFMRLVLLASLWVRARDRAIVVSNGTMGLF